MTKSNHYHLRTGAIIVLLFVALTACGGGIPFLNGDPTPTPAPTTSAAQPAEPTPTLAAEDALGLDDEQQSAGIEAVGRAFTGDVRAMSDVSIVPKASGQIEAVHVDIGDTVAAGDVIIELEHETLEAQVQQAQAGLAAAEAGVQQAQAGLAAAEAQLAQAQKGAKLSELDAARKGVEAAEAALTRLRSSPTKEDLIQLEAQYRQAEAAVRQAQAAYDQIKWREDAAAFPQALQLEQATLQFEAIKAQYEDALEGPEENQIKQAEAQLAEAQANWERVEEGTPDEQIAALDAQVQQAQAGLAAANAQFEQAQAALELARIQRENATIVAPIAGQIARIDAQIGMLASPQQPRPLVTIVSSDVEIIFSIDETLVGEIAAGDSVEIVPDALPDTMVQGTITRISPVIDPQTRTVDVIAEPDVQEGTLRSGMSVTVRIVS